MPKEYCDEQFQEDLSIAAHIDYRLYASTDQAKEVINSLVDSALREDQSQRKALNPQSRSRKRDMIERLRYCLTLILSNLVYLSFDYGADASLRISRSKKETPDRRYNPTEFTQKASILSQDLLSSSKIALIRLHKGKYDYSGRHSIQTILKPSKKLLKAVKNLVREDFSHKPPQEVIVLKEKQETNFEDRQKSKGKWIPYEDTEYTVEARKQIIEINRFLSTADIKFFGEIRTQKDRQIRRYFNTTFSRGGRLFGGIWQNSSKVARGGFTINGEECVEVDYQACGLRLAYARVGLDMTRVFPKDPYKYIGYERAGVKQMISAMLCSNSKMKAFPKDVRKNLGVSKHVKVGEVTDSIEKRFADIAHLFYSGVGLELMHIESEVLINALLRLKSKGVVALPIHDCVVVAESDQEAAKEEMLKAFKEVSGQFGVASVKTLKLQLQQSNNRPC